MGKHLNRARGNGQLNPLDHLISDTQEKARDNEEFRNNPENALMFSALLDKAVLEEVCGEGGKILLVDRKGAKEEYTPTNLDIIPLEPIADEDSSQGRGLGISRLMPWKKR
jgi:hypothetical protein